MTETDRRKTFFIDVEIPLRAMIFAPGLTEDKSVLSVFNDDECVFAEFRLDEIEIFEIEDDEIPAAQQASLLAAELRALADKVERMVPEKAKPQVLPPWGLPKPKGIG